jgi:hypothetical protein
MIEFFIEGGWGMYPVLVLGLVLLGASVRYAMDGEPIRLRFIWVTSFALLVVMAHSTWTCVAAVFQFVRSVPQTTFQSVLMTGLMESTRPATLGGALLSVALIIVSIGTYRSGRRELRALQQAGPATGP